MRQEKGSISRVLASIDWKRIKAYHAKLGITWEYEVDKEIIHRVPTVPELKGEMQSILQHMIDNGLDYISYGNWIVFWDCQDDGGVRVVFRLADFSFGVTEDSEASLEETLRHAIESENYEYAATIRDKINRVNDANNNLK